MSGNVRVNVEGLRELRKRLAQLEGDASWKPALRDAGKAAAEVVAAEARVSAARGAVTLAGTPASMGARALGTIRALAAQTRATVAGGSAGVPWFGGWEFGSSGAYPQFPPKVKGGRNLYPALARTRDEVIAVYTRELDQVIERFL